MTTLSFTKPELIKALEARRPWCRRVDREAAKEHQAEEKAALRRLHQQARVVLGLKTYDAAKLHFKNHSRAIYFEQPGCPRSLESQLDAQLGYLAVTNQQRFRVESTGGWGAVHMLLTKELEDQTRKDLCA